MKDYNEGTEDILCLLMSDFVFVRKVLDDAISCVEDNIVIIYILKGMPANKFNIALSDLSHFSNDTT